MIRLVFLNILILQAILCSGQQRVVSGEITISTEKTTLIHGEWEFYWQQLLGPGDPDFQSSQKTYFEFPALWNKRTLEGQELSNFGYATYRCLVKADTLQELTLHIEDVYSAYSLYWNGKLISKNGRVATTENDFVPYWQPDYVRLLDVRPENELILQIANFTHSKGGSSQPIEIGNTRVLEQKEYRVMAYDLLLTGCLLMGGLFFLGLYFFGRHDKALLYFSLFCIAYSYRIFGTGYYALHELVSWSWYVTTKLEYLTLFLSALFFGRFVLHLYPTEAPKIIWDISSVICLLFLVVTLFFPPKIYTLLTEPFFIILLFYLALTTVIYVRARIRNRPGATFAMLSTVVVFAVFAYNIMVYFGLLQEQISASFWGYILFFFSQSLILSFRFAFFLKQAKIDAEQASRAKSDFLSTISHEIRTPLNSVVGISHYLMDENPRDDQKQSLKSLKYSAEHLTTLISDILDYNKLESENITFEEVATDLSEVLLGVYGAHLPKAQSKNLNLEYHCDEGITHEVFIDKTRLIQVLNNLLDNAVKFTKQGSIQLKASLVKETETSLEIKFEVSDTGIGIEPQKAGLIFERFTQASSSTTREYGGTGLGLSICKKILELQGVELKVKSQIGGGSTFYFIQKLKKSKPIATKTDTVVKKTDPILLMGKKILLVEDNSMNVMVASKFLKKWMMELDLAQNGKEAVEKVQQNEYDILLMDLQMPVMDGYEATREIRQMGKQMPIVALTASALMRVQEKVIDSGMNDYLTKPFNPDELYQKLVKNLGI